MEQQLELDVGSPSGLTEWVKGPPPRIGWWEVCLWGFTADRPKDNSWPRRWWNGSAWSWAVNQEDDEDRTVTMQHRLSTLDPEKCFYRGLREPDPRGYGYSFTTGRRRDD